MNQTPKPKSRHSIPPKLHHLVIEKADEGMTYMWIRDWLLSEHGVVTSHASVERIVKPFMRQRKAERKSIAEQAYAKAIADAAPKDMELIDENQRILRAMRDDLLAKGDAVGVRQSIKEMNNVAFLRAKLSGVDHKEETPNESKQVKESLLDLLELMEQEEESKTEAN